MYSVFPFNSSTLLPSSKKNGTGWGCEPSLNHHELLWAVHPALRTAGLPSYEGSASFVVSLLP